MHLLGTPSAMVPIAGRSPAASIFLAERADALVYYCSGAKNLLKNVGCLPMAQKILGEGAPSTPPLIRWSMHEIRRIAVRNDVSNPRR